MRSHFLAAALAAITFLPALAAQQVTGGPDRERAATNVSIATETFETLAAVSISYGQAQWRNGYDDMLDQLKGNYARLGKGWWTTLDTVGAIEIGGTKLAPGSYYLGLAVAADGAFSLLIFDSAQAMKHRLLPFTTALYTGEFKADFVAPMTFAKDSLKDVVAKLEIEITADQKAPTNGKLSIRWGKHELSAPVKFELAAAKDAAKDANAPKK